jgi:hypothetical protein
VRAWRALYWTTLSLTVRLLRERFVIRSLVWPPIISVLALGGTVAVALLLGRAPIVAVGPDAAALEPALRAEGLAVVEAGDPEASARSGAVDAATDGRSVWGHRGSTEPVERVVRRAVHASWYPAGGQSDRGQPNASTNGLLPRLVAILYPLSGAVFGLASVARHRDDGTLEAELALPIPRWVPGAARWIAPTVVLGAAILGNILLYGAILNADADRGLLLAGAAAAAGSVALGIAVVGTHGLDRGLSGPLSVALVAVAGLVGLGLAAPAVGALLPVSSVVVAGSSGWVPLFVSLVAGAGASGAFAIRSARA